MKVVFHVPTAEALARAREEAGALEETLIDGMVRVVVVGRAVEVALNDPDPATDHMLILCQHALRQLDRQAPAGIETVPDATQLLARLQRKGWAYIRP